MTTIDQRYADPDAWAALLVEFRESLLAEGLTVRSAEEYVRYARRFLRWCDRKMVTPLTIAPSGVYEFGETMPYSRSVRKNARTAVMRLMFALDREDGAWRALRTPRKPLNRTRALEPGDARRLREAALMVGGRQGLATLIGLYTAARRVEIAMMQWDGIDLERGRIQWYRTKTGDVTAIPLHPILAGELEYFPRYGTHVFPGNDGRPHVAAATVWQWVRTVGAQAGLDVTTHQLRHTALATALDATKDLRAVQTLAGHRDPGVTAGYTRTTEKRLRAAVLAIDEYDTLDEQGDSWR